MDCRELAFISSERRAEVLGVLERAGEPLGVEHVAAELHIGRSTARHHLELLATAGFVHRTSHQRGTAGRPEILYAATAKAPRADAVEYERLARALATQLAESPDVAAIAVEAGRRWARVADEQPGSAGPESNDDASRLVALLAGLGFQPEYTAPKGRVILRRCPFESVARDHRAVICGVHEGMILESLQRMGDRYVVRSFEPFVGDDPPLCIIELARRQGGSRSTGPPVD